MIRLTDEQWERIRDHFPEENIADGRPERKPIPTRCVFEAVLWILNTGQTWCRDEVLRRVLTDVANEFEECLIDATFVMASVGDGACALRL